MSVAVTVIGFALAVVAAAWPYLSKLRPAAPTAPLVGADTIPDRAGWVNRLFVLAAQADATQSQDVAATARALISALVAPKRG
jgi:hypothetical protein